MTGRLNILPFQNRNSSSELGFKVKAFILDLDDYNHCKRIIVTIDL